jgi:hypothetical protein
VLDMAFIERAGMTAKLAEWRKLAAIITKN